MSTSRDLSKTLSLLQSNIESRQGPSNLADKMSSLELEFTSLNNKVASLTILLNKTISAFQSQIDSINSRCSSSICPDSSMPSSLAIRNGSNNIKIDQVSLKVDDIRDELLARTSSLERSIRDISSNITDLRSKISCDDTSDLTAALAKLEGKVNLLGSSHQKMIAMINALKEGIDRLQSIDRNHSESELFSNIKRDVFSEMQTILSDFRRSYSSSLADMLKSFFEQATKGIKDDIIFVNEQNKETSELLENTNEDLRETKLAVSNIEAKFQEIDIHNNSKLSSVRSELESLTDIINTSRKSERELVRKITELEDSIAFAKTLDPSKLKDLITSVKSLNEIKVGVLKRLDSLEHGEIFNRPETMNVSKLHLDTELDSMKQNLTGQIIVLKSSLEALKNAENKDARLVKERAENDESSIAVISQEVKILREFMKKTTDNTNENVGHLAAKINSLRNDFDEEKETNRSKTEKLERQLGRMHTEMTEILEKKSRSSTDIEELKQRLKILVEASKEPKTPLNKGRNSQQTCDEEKLNAYVDEINDLKEKFVELSINVAASKEYSTVFKSLSNSISHIEVVNKELFSRAENQEILNVGVEENIRKLLHSHIEKSEDIKTANAKIDEMISLLELKHSRTGEDISFIVSQLESLKSSHNEFSISHTETAHLTKENIIKLEDRQKDDEIKLAALEGLLNHIGSNLDSTKITVANNASKLSNLETDMSLFRVSLLAIDTTFDDKIKEAAEILNRSVPEDENVSHDRIRRVVERVDKLEGEIETFSSINRKNNASSLEIIDRLRSDISKQTTNVEHAREKSSHDISELKLKLSKADISISDIAKEMQEFSLRMATLEGTVPDNQRFSELNEHFSGKHESLIHRVNQLADEISKSEKYEQLSDKHESLTYRVNQLVDELSGSSKHENLLRLIADLRNDFTESSINDTQKIDSLVQVVEKISNSNSERFEVLSKEIQEMNKTHNTIITDKHDTLSGLISNLKSDLDKVTNDHHLTASTRHETLALLVSNLRNDFDKLTTEHHIAISTKHETLSQMVTELRNDFDNVSKEPPSHEVDRHETLSQLVNDLRNDFDKVSKSLPVREVDTTLEKTKGVYAFSTDDGTTKLAIVPGYNVSTKKNDKDCISIFSKEGRRIIIPTKVVATDLTTTNFELTGRLNGRHIFRQIVNKGNKTVNVKIDGNYCFDVTGEIAGVNVFMDSWLVPPGYNTYLWCRTEEGFKIQCSSKSVGKLNGESVTSGVYNVEWF